MAWPGFFSYGGIEIINASRTEAYARRGNVGWFKPIYKESELAWLLGDGKYTSALQDDAPWTDPENLDSYDFLGVYPLEITGIEDSTVGASITESVIDGGYIGRSRRSTKAVVFNAVLSGLSECAVEYGLRWLRTVLSGNPCFGSAYGNCGGADLCYLACAPVIGDPPTTISEGPIVVDAVNLATNPNAEVGQDGGWYTNDPAKWAISAPTAGAISGTRSVMATRLADVLDRTNLALNPNLETNATGWNTNSVAAYPTTLDTGSAMSGINSLRTDRTATSLSTACASIQITTAGTTSAGFPCTPGVPMTTSLNVKCSLANRRVSMSYQWLDGANAVISSTTPTNKVSDTGAALSVVRAVNTETPPFGAVTCRAIVTVATLGGNATVGEQVWFDSLLVEKDLTATSTVDRTNLMPNPSLGGGSASYWSSGTPANYPVTVDSTAPITGTYSAMATRTATSPNRFTISLELMGLSPGSAMLCTPGVPIFAAVDVKAELAGRRVQLYFEWFNAAGAYLSDSTRSAFTALTAGQVSRPTYSATPPAGAVGARMVVNCEVANLSNATTGERTWLDNAYVGTGSDTSSLDGATAPAGDNWYRWTGTANASTSERLLIANRSAPSTYYDGGTPDTGAYDYRWSGTANASTSQRWKANDTTAASLYFTADVSTPFGVTPGEPVTLGIDVKVEQPNRRITGYFSWVGGGVSPAVGIPAGPVGSVTRFVMTATPPPGVTAVYPVVDVTSTSGSALNGERVWWDNLYVGNVVSGDYFDGSTPEDGDLNYGWTGADNASTSRRFVQTWVNDPPPPPEECYERVGRSLHEVTITVGPSVTAKMEMNDGGVAWTVTWTAVAANPVEYGMERPLIVGFLDPAVDIPYAEGAVPVGGGFDEDGYVQTEVKCPTAGFVPVFDPLCKLLVPPPDVPAVAPTCFSFPVNYTRRSFRIPKSKIPLWGQVVPIVQLTTTTTESRSVRLRFYADVFDTGSPNDDPCNFCGDMLVSYIPPGSTLVLDGTDHSVYIDQPGQGRRRADSLVSDSSGNPFEWPEFSCGFGYVVTVDLPQQTAHLPIVDLSLVPRAA